jgi:uncharacterized protein
VHSAPLEAVTAAWQHRGARDGFEVLFMRTTEDGYRCEGAVSAVEAGCAWTVRYDLDLDRLWTTRSAHVSSLSSTGLWELRLEANGRGAWHVNGRSAPDLAGCFDIDLEASAFTNALPVHRLRLAVGDHAAAPAAYVRTLEPRVERLEQRYERLADGEGRAQQYEYAAPRFDFRAVLVYDDAGLILDYPGLAVRVS